MYNSIDLTFSCCAKGTIDSLIMPKTVVPSLANYQLDESLSSPNSYYSVLRTLSTRAQLCAASRGGGLHQQQESKQVCHLHLFWNFLTNKNSKSSRGCNVDCQTRKPPEPTHCPSFSLLHTLVQSCGYAFHLQISTKEFLNELVRRFPERPPPFPNPVMTRILDLIHGWKEGICSDSRWKEDLGNIRDMHRLLTFKGYRFRELGQQSLPLDALVRSGAALQ